MNKVKKFFWNKPKNYLKRHGRKLLIAYLIGLLPMGYINTALTTNISITQGKRVITKLWHSGIINISSLGIQKPISNASKYAIGLASKKLGNITNSTTLKGFGDKTISQSKKWFNYGKDIVNDSTPIEVGEISKPQKENTNKNIPQKDEHTDWDSKKFPNYYRVFEDKFDPNEFIEKDFLGMKKGQTKYSKLDKSGRTGEVKSIITYKMVEDSRGTREHFTKDSDPSGWGNNSKVTIRSVDGSKTYNGYFWNRSNLLADSLGGSAIRENLVTGTRMQNVGFGKGGMAYMESKLRDFFKNPTDKVVYFKATPFYANEDIIPSHVDLKVYSSDGSILEYVRVYNTAYGYKINYEKGTFEEIK